jgi:hypothetical protein
VANTIKPTRIFALVEHLNCIIIFITFLRILDFIV